MKEGNVCKVMVCKTIKGTYYVQEMPGYYGCGRRWVIMKDRKRYQYRAQYRDYATPEAACAAMLEAVRRDVLLQTEIKLTPKEEAFLKEIQSL